MKKLLAISLLLFISVSIPFSARSQEIKTVRDARQEGLKNIRAKKYAEALKCCETGLQICKDPREKQQFLSMIGSIFAAENKFDSAVAKYVEASAVPGILQDDIFLNIYYAGHYSTVKKDNDGAIKYFRKAFEIQGVKNYKRLQNICITRICGILFTQKKDDECIKTADEGIAKIKGDDASIHNLLDRKGAAFARKKDFVSAQKAISEAMQLKNITDEERLASARRSAEFYALEKKFAKAAEVSAMAADTFNKVKNKNLLFTCMSDSVRYYLNAKEYAKALEMVKKYENTITAPAGKLALYLNGMLAAFDNKNMKECEELSLKAEKFLASGNWLQKNRYYEIRGRVLEMKGDFAGAEKMYLEAGKIPGLNKNYVSVSFSKVAELYYLKKKDPVKAKEFMDKAKAAGTWYNQRVDALIRRDLKKLQK